MDRVEYTHGRFAAMKSRSGTLTEAREFRLSDALLDRLARARSVLVLTGAGMSAESGIPTFRDAQTGIWSKFRPEELATPEAFAADPDRVWRWYEARRKTVREAQPHAGYLALVELEALVGELNVVTQNVDGLHQRAGSHRVWELHGNILRSKCHLSLRPIGREWIEESPQTPPPSPYVPEGLARPDVVWFGEALPTAAVEAAVEAASRCDFCFSIGTSSLVQPAASLPLYALERGAPLVEINPEHTPLSAQADQCIRGMASEVLVTVVSQLQAAKRENR
ncbi:MAG: NAD-dependent deacylase [Xanthomonadales bacterium]|nr:NAD-dependent deacylase [Xanthomonadales bacterium]